MMDQNISELLFEEFRADTKIQYLSVPGEENRKTPDYDLVFGTLRGVAEVKEIERNEGEKASDRLLELRRYGNISGGVPGQRVRQKIQSCLPQIRARAQGIHPSLLVLYDQHSGGTNIDPYHIPTSLIRNSDQSEKRCRMQTRPSAHWRRCAAFIRAR